MCRAPHRALRPRLTRCAPSPADITRPRACPPVLDGPRAGPVHCPAVHDAVLMLPEPERRTWLLAALADLLRGADWRQFVGTPIVLPRPEHFPERWTPDLRGVRLLIRRLMRFADLELAVHVELFEGRPPHIDSLGMRLGAAATHHRGAAGLYFGTHAGVAHFGADVGMLDDPAGVTATLAHEVAHAYRERHDLADADPAVEEQLTDLTAVFLGFGVLTANASLRHRSGPVKDRLLGHQWSTQRLGYLDPQDLCFLLAVQVHLRRASAREIASHLETNQAAFFKAALKWLAADKPDLDAELGLPPVATWPKLDDLAPLLRPLDDDLQGDDPDDDDPDDIPAADESAVRLVFRVWRRPWSDRLPLVLAIFFAAVLAIALLPRDPIGLTLVATLAALAVVATGHRRSPVCSDPTCRTAIPRAAHVCPGCGGAVAGDLDFADQRLATEEAARGQQHAPDPHAR
jgi:hypothetical protein